MWTLIITILSTVGGTTAIIGFFQRMMINSMNEMQRHANMKAIEEIKKTHAESLMNLEFKYQREIEKYKIDLNNYMRYSDEQFKLYNEFWSSLYDLKQEADNLWGRADSENLFSFAKQLKETRVKVEKSRLFVEEDHYNHLKEILEIYSQYSLGKTQLISLRRNKTIENIEIYDLINSNELVKMRYDHLMEDIFKSIKEQIYLPSPNRKNN